jgi:hypothetical protein
LEKGIRAMSINSEVAKLFSRLTVDQVIERETQLRLNVQQKEQQLRRLVSERYRELVESEDTLRQMQLESRRVVSHIEMARNVRAREERRHDSNLSSSSWQLAQVNLHTHRQKQL